MALLNGQEPQTVSWTPSSSRPLREAGLKKDRHAETRAATGQPEVARLVLINESPARAGQPSTITSEPLGAETQPLPGLTHLLS